MGNLMCCRIDKLHVTNSPRTGGDGSDTVKDQPQRERNKQNTLISGESNAKGSSKLSSAKNILPIENENRIQALEHTTSQTIPKPATYERIKVLNSKPSFLPQQVSRNVRSVKQCNACGEFDNLTESCRYHTRLCFYCREEGHIVRICSELKRAKKSIGLHRNGTTKVPTQKGRIKQNHDKQ